MSDTVKERGILKAREKPPFPLKPKIKKVRVAYRCTVCSIEKVIYPDPGVILPQNGICPKCAGAMISRNSMDSDY